MRVMSRHVICCSRRGNDEPLSYIDLGMQQRDTGTIHPLKVLGCLPLIDVSRDVMDFKIVGIHHQVRRKGTFAMAGMTCLTEYRLTFDVYMDDRIRWLPR